MRHFALLGSWLDSKILDVFHHYDSVFLLTAYDGQKAAGI